MFWFWNSALFSPYGWTGCICGWKAMWWFESVDGNVLRNVLGRFWVVILAVLFVNLMVPWNENYKYYLIVMISTLFCLVHFGNSNIVVASLLSQFCLTCYIKGRIKFVRYSNLGIWNLCYFELTDSFVLLGVMSYMIMRERFCSIGVLFMG